MISVSVQSAGIRAYFERYPKDASRALEVALDKTAIQVMYDERREMSRVFDNPTPYTMKSLKVTRTRGHNMIASVWFKEPVRMSKHYLVPQVEGGQRELKGFERALSNKKFVPGQGARSNKYGNISHGQIRQVLSVLGKAEMTAGYQANLTAKSAKRNRKARDYVYLPGGSASGKLPPGIYERVARRGKGFGGKAKKSLGKFGTYQKGRKRGRYFSVVRARGLRPILLLGQQQSKVRPLFKFYRVARRTQRKVLYRLFIKELDSRLGR